MRTRTTFPRSCFRPLTGYLALFVTHDGFWRSLLAEAGITGFPTMAERAANRDEVLAVVSAALATDTAIGWEARLQPLGIPAAAVRTLPEALEALPEIVVSAGDYRLVGSSIRVDGYEPDYRPPPLLGEHGGLPAVDVVVVVVVDDHGPSGTRLAGQHVALVDLVVVEGVVDPHGRGAFA